MEALRIIYSEHRSLAAVLHGMLHVVRSIREHGKEPDFALLGTMVYYIDRFPERFHHPKEDAYLFPVLRERDPTIAPVLDQLEQEHRIGAEKIRDLEQALARYQNGGPAELDAFADAVEAYAAMHWTHMRTEETEVLPRAEKTFTADDWKIVDAAFGSHGDPLLGVDRGTQYEALFRRIVNLAPPPIGVGPERY